MQDAANRFPPLAPEQMSAEQKRVADAIASGPRGGLAGPFSAWLRSPELADRFQRVGEYVRFHSSIPQPLNELAILVTARAWNARFEWWAHYQLALKAGLGRGIADAIGAGRRPEGMSEDERVVYGFCSELQAEKAVSDATFAAARARFGDQGVVDLIGVTGYYTAVAMTLNVARVPVPEGTDVPPLRAGPE